MSILYRKLQKLTGMDGAVFYRLCAIAVSLLAGPLAIVLMTMKFTLEEQGVYYTFVSITALQIFFELGMTGIITQYVAHEFAHLRITPGDTFTGDDSHLSRLASLFTLFTKWFLVTAILLMGFLLVMGYMFFASFEHHTDVAWQMPWVTLSLGTALTLVFDMYLAFYEGFDYVREMSLIRLLAHILGTIVLILCFVCGHGLYALGMSAILRNILIFLCFLKKRYRTIATVLWLKRQTERISYWSEIFPYQWKVSLSWISGYLIFNLFNPLLFAFCGPSVAGQMGMTMSILNNISAISTVWINTKIPRMSIFISQKEYNKLDPFFYRSFFQALAIALAITLSFIAVFIVLHNCDFEYNGVLLRERVLPLDCIIFMAASVLTNVFSYSFATYLRCHKQEPFLIYSVVTGVSVAIASYFTVKYSGVSALCTSYFIITVLCNIYGFFVFRSKKKEWHHV